MQKETVDEIVGRALRGEPYVPTGGGDDAPAQPAAPQGVAYAELPEPIWRTAQGVAFSERQLYDFADRTHGLRTSRGQTLRLLTQKERDILGRRAEGMDGNEWDQWVQEKFAQVNGLKVQGGSYEWGWE